MAAQAQTRLLQVLAHAAPPLVLAALMEAVWQRRMTAMVLGCVGAGVLLCGLCAPKWYRRWNQYVQALITAVMRSATWIILTVVYLGIVTVIRLLRSLLRRDVLALRFPARDTSFWRPCHQRHDRDSYRRQY